MSISLLADADLNFAIVTGTRLRDSRIDFLSAAEATLQGISDPEVLTFAERQGRILVSHDTSTIPRRVPVYFWFHRKPQSAR